MPMIDEVCAHIHNYFDMDEHRKYWHRERGTFTITGGRLTLDFLQPGQYYRIEGSVFNDGVHQYEGFDLTDEQFEGSVYAMRVKPGFMALLREIEAWQEKNGATVQSPYQSESFGGYSYTLASGSTKSGGTQSAGWELTFGKRLDAYRKICL